MKSCYLIAALEANHNGDLALAKRMVDESVSSGCDAVKIPRKHVDSFLSSEVQKQPLFDFPEMGSTVGQVQSALELSFDDIKELRDYCKGKIDFIAAPYDETSFKEMDALGPDGYQIDPPVVVHLPLLEKLKKQNKPIYAVIASVNEVDINHMVQILGRKVLTLLHGVLASPLQLEETSLGTINHLKKRFGIPVGYFGLDEGTEASLVALTLGASVIEKPFTLDRHLRGPHHAMSAGREEWHALIRSVRAIEIALVPVDAKTLKEIELETFNQQRISLVAAKAIPKGTVLEESSIAIKASGSGISPRLMKEIVGKKVLYDLDEGTPLTFGVVSN